MAQHFEVEGLAELEQALIDIGAATGIKALRSSGRKAMKTVLEAAKSGAHEDTGQLKQAMTISTKRDNKSSTRAIDINVGPTRKTVTQKNSDGTKNKHKLSNINQKAIAQEYGTSKQKADPFLRPALEDNVGTVLSSFKTELASAIKKAARKYDK